MIPRARVVSQGVYGEVAPFQIFLNGGGLGHGVRVAPIAVGAVGAVGGDLQRLAVAHYRERAMGDAVSTVPQPASRKASWHRGQAARRDIHIVVGPPEQSVANEAAHAPCLPSGLLDDFQSIMGGKRKGQRLGEDRPRNRFAGSEFVFTSSTDSDRLVGLCRV